MAETNATQINILERGKETQGIYKPLPKRLYTLREGAFYLGRTLWGIRELVWAGKIPVVRSGKRMFVDIRDLDSFIEKSKFTYPNRGQISP